jgi:hypothetical protein
MSRSGTESGEIECVCLVVIAHYFVSGSWAEYVHSNDVDS